MKTQRVIFVMAFYMLLAMWTARYDVFLQRALVDVMLWVSIAFSAALACIADSKVRSRPMVHSAKLGLLVYWPVTVPVYLVWSRGWRGLVWIGVHLLAVMVVFAAAGVVLGSVLGLQAR
ncbi:MAG TPA: hypothetical protein VG711_12385 [Phycisphaerales bacterium]|nr:hypothetical protein [Phycisphaerales bacterium]